MLLAPFINQQLDAPVWRMEIDEVSNTLFAELRDTANKRVSFAAINLESGNTNFAKLILPERWLNGIEIAIDGVLLLHGYQSESIPVHKGLTAVNGVTGEVLWTDYRINFELLSPDGVVVYDARIQTKKLFIIDAQTGMHKVAYTPVKGDVQSSIRSPQMLPADALPAALLILQPHANVVHYLKHNNFRIVSLHALNGGHLTQYLYVFNTAGELIFDDIMNNNIQKLQPEAFISYKNKLIWLQNRSVIKVLNL